MGQYYMGIILGEENEENKEIIRLFIEAFMGAKLTEHSWPENGFVNAFETFLTPEGMFYKSRVVWAGDYADHEKNMDENLHHNSSKHPQKSYFNMIRNQILTLDKSYRYIINHTTKQYVDKNKYSFHPLPLLIAEGNGRGGGDFDSRYSQRSVQWAVNRVAKDAGIKKEVSVHTLRHSYACHLLEDGMNIVTLQELMGHSNIETTMEYLHLCQLDDRKMFSPLDTLFAQCALHTK
jgi:hypothetical protein